MYGQRKKTENRVYPAGHVLPTVSQEVLLTFCRYVEMLEEHQARLVNALQKLYVRVKNNEGWPGSPLEERVASGPLTHDILKRLGVLEPKNDDLCQLSNSLEESACFLHVKDTITQCEDLGFQKSFLPEEPPDQHNDVDMMLDNLIMPPNETNIDLTYKKCPMGESLEQEEALLDSLTKLTECSNPRSSCFEFDAGTDIGEISGANATILEDLDDWCSSPGLSYDKSFITMFDDSFL